MNILDAIEQLKAFSGRPVAGDPRKNELYVEMGDHHDIVAKQDKTGTVQVLYRDEIVLCSSWHTAVEAVLERAG
jgi:hypothetical protein